MRLFLAALAAVYLIAAALSYAQTEIPLGQERTGIQLILLNILLIPTAAAWAAAETAALLRRPRLFDRRLRAPLARPALGLLAGMLGAVTAALVLPWVDRYAPDALITGLSSALPAALAVLILRRRRPSACIYCQYDLSTGPAPGRPGFGLCPECGAGVIQA